MLLADHLEAANLGIETVVVTDGGYPKDPSVFDDAAAVVVACDGGVRHLLNQNLKEFDAVMRRGVEALRAFTTESKQPKEQGTIFSSG